MGGFSLCKIIKALYQTTRRQKRMAECYKIMSVSNRWFMSKPHLPSKILVFSIGKSFYILRMTLRK